MSVLLRNDSHEEWWENTKRFRRFQLENYFEGTRGCGIEWYWGLLRMLWQYPLWYIGIYPIVYKWMTTHSIIETLLTGFLASIWWGCMNLINREICICIIRKRFGLKTWKLNAEWNSDENHHIQPLGWK